MKVKPECYPMILDLSTRLAPVVPDGRAARERRRIESACAPPLPCVPAKRCRTHQAMRGSPGALGSIEYDLNWQTPHLVAGESQRPPA